MSIRLAAAAIFAWALVFSASGFAESKADLHAAAKVKEIDARKVALGQVPPRSVVESVELEREGGKVVWSYDLRIPSSKQITEVQIDAITGAVANKYTESPKDEAAEAAADRESKH
jgi:hypothetical protein